MLKYQHPYQILFVVLAVMANSLMAQNTQPDSLCGHKVILDTNNKLLPFATGDENPYDHFLRLRWNFVLTKAPNSPGPPPRSSYPQYYFYCAWRDSADILLPDLWMNDVGEKIPNWFESAYLYYIYTGSMEPLTITKGLADYSLQHGRTPSSYSWPFFPQTGADAGDLEFRGFASAKRFSTDDVQVDHAGDMGLTFYKLYQFYGEKKYRDAAVDVANVLARKLQPGDSAHSPWPYVVNMKTGETVSEYGTNWFGCIRLLDMLIAANEGDVKKYIQVRKTVLDWIYQYPVQNGHWVDGHSDNKITGTRNLSNMSASNAALYISDYLSQDERWTRNLPVLIKWTEENFIDKSAPGEPSTIWSANIVSEQVDFMPKMDYQTARYAAQCAGWYAKSGDPSYKEKAFRSLNFVTYCNDKNGKAFESPFSKGVNSWWSDCYGEGPRMFYHVFAAIPEWAPRNENHILYSGAVLKKVSYSANKVEYETNEVNSREYLRLTFKPASIRINNHEIISGNTQNKQGYTIRDLEDGDYFIQIFKDQPGKVVIKK